MRTTTAAWAGFGLVLLVLAGRHVLSASASPTPAWDALEARLEDDGWSTERLSGHGASLADVDARGRVFLVLDRPRSDGELAALRKFAHGGGAIVVLNDAEVAEAFGAAISPATILMPDGAPVTAIEGSRVRAHVEAPRPVLDEREGARALLATPESAFVDADGDGIGGSGDVPGPFSIARLTPAGVVVAGFPLASAQEEGNAGLLDVLLSAVGRHRSVLVDDTSPASRAALLARVPLALPGALADSTFLAAAAVASAILSGATREASGRSSRRERLDDPVLVSRRGRR